MNSQSTSRASSRIDETLFPDVSLWDKGFYWSSSFWTSCSSLTEAKPEKSHLEVLALCVTCSHKTPFVVNEDVEQRKRDCIPVKVYSNIWKCLCFLYKCYYLGPQVSLGLLRILKLWVFKFCTAFVRTNSTGHIHVSFIKCKSCVLWYDEETSF